jgi:pantoate--beta-alanine ligase
MGALHAGHQALVRTATQHAQVVVVTVFVNQTQFGPGEDFERYPRTLARDLQLALEAGASAVFAPENAEIYPAGEQTRVTVHGLSDGLCGATRPGHFTGVATVVAKLFALFSPATFVFGSKDYQQLQILRRLARDLLFPIVLVGHPIVREPDGLALSSRNAYLSQEDRARALSIPRALAAAAAAFAAGERKVRVLREVVRGALDRGGLRVEYVDLGHPETLQLLEDGAEVFEHTLLAVAVRCGSTRLIDNLILGQDAPPELGH